MTELKFACARCDYRESNNFGWVRTKCPHCGWDGAEQDADPVREPAHYTVGGIETIDYMAAKSTPEEFRGHLRLTAMKYLSRAGHKGDALQDYRKAQVYLGWLVKFIETGSHK